MPGLLRYSIRSLRQARLLTALVVVTLAVGIGTTTAVFSVVRAVLIQPLPWHDAHRLIMIWHRSSAGGGAFGLTDRDVLVYSQDSSTLDRIVAYYAGGATRSRADGLPEGLWITYVSPGLFPTLGTTPQAGRLFAPVEYISGPPLVAIASHEFWRRSLGGDPAVVGRAIDIDDRRVAIVGVMPPDYRLPTDYRWVGQADLWMPARLDASTTVSPREWWTIGRLKAGASEMSAREDLTALAQRSTAVSAAPEIGLVPVDREARGAARPALVIAMIAVGVVLTIACSNVASLSLTRGLGRVRDLAVRAALGARRSQLARLLLVENLVLAMAAGSLGVLLAFPLLKGLVGLAPANVPGLASVRLDAMVLALAVAVTILSGFAAGLAPVLGVVFGGIEQGLRQRSRSIVSSRGARLRGTLLAVQSALAVVLLVAASLLAQSFADLGRVDPGYAPGRVLTGDLLLPAARYPTGESRVAFYERVLRAVELVPGVQSAALTSSVPIWNPASMASIGAVVIESRAETSRKPVALAIEVVTPSAFATLGLALVDGRGFVDTDADGSQLVAVVSANVARTFWDGTSASGRRIRFAAPESSPWLTVVGVAEEVRDLALDSAPHPRIYVPLKQAAASEDGRVRSYMALMIATHGDPGALARPVQQAVASADAQMPLANARPLDEYFEQSRARQRFAMVLLAGFGTVAVVLTLIAVYGAVSHHVSMRSRETAVRMALGAREREVVRLLMAHGLKPLAAGLAGGLVAAGFGSRILRDLLYQTSPLDPGTFSGVALVLFLAGTVACWHPGRRSVHGDPVRALRAE